MAIQGHSFPDYYGERTATGLPGDTLIASAAVVGGWWRGERWTRPAPVARSP